MKKNIQEVLNRGEKLDSAYYDDDAMRCLCIYVQTLAPAKPTDNTNLDTTDLTHPHTSLCIYTPTTTTKNRHLADLVAARERLEEVQVGRQEALAHGASRRAACLYGCMCLYIDRCLITVMGGQGPLALMVRWMHCVYVRCHRGPPNP